MAEITRKEQGLTFVKTGDNPCLSSPGLNDANVSRPNLPQAAPLFDFCPEWQYTVCV